jgi:hypothetical protein
MSHAPIACDGAQMSPQAPQLSASLAKPASSYSQPSAAMPLQSL